MLHSIWNSRFKEIPKIKNILIGINNATLVISYYTETDVINYHPLNSTSSGLLINLLVDVLYVYLDPRVQRS